MPAKCDPAMEVLRQQIRHERELREQSTTMAAMALQKQAAEYERRLEELNHAHARSLEDRSEFLQKNIYEQTQKELATWKLQVTAETTMMAERLKADQIATATTLATNQRFVNWIMGGLMLALAIANFILAQLGTP